MSKIDDLFKAYFEVHEEVDDGWCMKHLPSISQVKAALAVDYIKANVTPANCTCDPDWLGIHHILCPMREGQS